MFLAFARAFRAINNEMLAPLFVLLYDRWTLSHMKIWQLEVKRRNPNIDLPDPWEIARQTPVVTKAEK